MPTNWQARMERLWQSLRIVLGALFVGFALMAVFLTLKHRQEHIVILSELSTLRVENNELRTRVARYTTEFDSWAADIERVLFGQIAPALANKPVPAGATRVELWSVNKDKELRARINALERSRMAIEARIAKLEAELRQMYQEQPR